MNVSELEKWDYVYMLSYFHVFMLSCVHIFVDYPKCFSILYIWVVYRGVHAQIHRITRILMLCMRRIQGGGMEDEHSGNKDPVVSAEKL